MSVGQRSFCFYRIKGFTFVVIALALLMSVTAFGAGGARFAFIDSAAEFLGLRSGVGQVFSNASASGVSDAVTSEVSSAFAGITVALPNVNSTPGTLVVPITVGSLTGQGIFSYDLQITFDPAVVTPASPAFDSTGTLSGAMSITPNAANPGHLIISAFTGTALTGSGTLLNLRFNVVGTPGQGTPLVFENYTDPGSTPHPGFRFNEGTPASMTTNGGVTVIAPPTATATNTSTNTPTSTPTFTPTNTPINTPTFTPTSTSTSTPTNTPTSTPTATPICPFLSIPDLTSLTNSPISMPVNTSDVTGMGAVSATFTIVYDPGVMTITGIILGIVGNSNGGGRTLSFNSPTAGTLNISITGVNPFAGSGALVNLNFNVFALPGAVSPVYFTTFQYNAGPPCGTADDGSVTVVAGTITGTVTYGNLLAPPNPRNVPNVLISGAGSPPVSVVTGVSGTYSLSGFGAGGYTITPSKTGGTNGAITGFDAARIAQYVVNLISLNPTQLTVADVSGSGGVSGFDATLVARYSIALGPPVGSAGNWIFNPVSNTHPTVYTDIANENYSALLMGDVSGSWGGSGGRPSNSGGPERSTAIKAPHLVTPADKEVLIPVSVQGAANKGIISYEFALRYDPAVIQPQANPVDLAGTVSRGLSAVTNAEEPGLLRGTIYGPMPITGSGVLLNLKFTAIGAPGSVSPLTWERLMLNEGDPRTTVTDGQVELSAATPNQAEINGRLLTAFGAGVPNSRVTLIDAAGQSRSILSDGFGVYRFGNLQIGQTYTVSVESRRNTFAPLTVSVTDQLVNVDMIAEP